jgi:hypothetical protein
MLDRISPRNQVTQSRKTTKSFLCAGLFVMMLMCLVPSALQAQYKASLRGTVTDPTGAVVPGATVTLVNTETNETVVVTSDGSGIYTFNALPPANFSLKAEHPGFQSKVIAQVVLIPEQPNALNIVLTIGDVTQTVTVSGSAAPLLDTDTATVSNTISSNEIQHLPSFNRDVFQLAQLTPGVFGDGSQSTSGTYNLPGNQGPGGSGGGGIFNIENGPQIQTRGGQYETNGISIDGMSTTSAVWGGTSVITPSEDSVSNVKISSNSYDAENGRFVGANIEVTSKGGSNDIHASAFIKGSRPGLNAYQRWNGPGSDMPGTAASRGVNRNDDRTNNYGASIGGPLWKNKLFAFFAYEASPTQANSTGQGWFETSQFDQTAAPAGSIAATYLNYPGESVAPGSTLIPQTCANAGLVQGVNCNQVTGGLDIGSPLTTPLGTMDPNYVSPTSPGLGNGFDGVPDIALFNTINPNTNSQKQFNGRVDADITHNDRLTFTIYWVPVSVTSYNGPARAANLWHHDPVNQATSLVWNHVFSPTLLNQARVNAAGWRYNEVETNPQAPFGLPQDNIGGIGSIGIANFGAQGPGVYNQWTYSYNDVLTKTWGRHNIKVGGDLTRLYYLNQCYGCSLPNYGMWNIWDFANDAPHSEYAQFNPKNGVPTSNRQDDRLNMFAGFVQDDFKLRPNLTVNIGLRYSYFGPMYSKQDNLSTAEFGAGAAMLTGASVKVGGNLYNSQKTNLGPQVGFAWQPMQSNNKLVIRGGYGINYNQNEIAILANGYGNPPDTLSGNLFSASNTAPAGLTYAINSDVHSILSYPANPYFITAFGPNNLPTGNTQVSLTGYNANPKTITNYHYSLDAEYQLPANTVATLGYQGSQLRHGLVNLSNWNEIAVAKGIPLNANIPYYDLWNNQGTSNYNGMTASIKHRLANNFNVEAMYTWAKSMDELSGPYSSDPYPYDPHSSYGRSDYNVQNAFKLYGLWQPVFFPRARGWVEKVAGDWSVSGIWNVHSGFPWNPVYNIQCCAYTSTGISQLRPTSYNGAAGASTSNKNFQGATNPSFLGGNGSNYYGIPSYDPVLAPFPATGAVPLPGIQRNSLTAPGYNDLDASLTKGFGFPKMRVLGEGARLEFRADGYNIFNRTNINAGSINNVIGTANPNGTITNPQTNFGTATGALGARVVQLQARFSF